MSPVLVHLAHGPVGVGWSPAPHTRWPVEPDHWWRFGRRNEPKRRLPPPMSIPGRGLAEPVSRARQRGEVAEVQRLGDLVVAHSVAAEMDDRFEGDLFALFTFVR